MEPVNEGYALLFKGILCFNTLHVHNLKQVSKVNSYSLNRYFTSVLPEAITLVLSNAVKVLLEGIKVLPEGI